MQQALGSRATVPAPLRAQARGTAAARGVPLLVQCSKKVTKKAQVVLVQDVPNLGASGALTSVRLGYFRCARAAPAARRAAPPRGRDSAAARTPLLLHLPAHACAASPAEPRLRCGVPTGTTCCPRGWPSWPTSPSWRRSRRSARLRRLRRARCAPAQRVRLRPQPNPWLGLCRCWTRPRRSPPRSPRSPSSPSRSRSAKTSASSAGASRPGFSADAGGLRVSCLSRSRPGQACVRRSGSARCARGCVWRASVAVADASAAQRVGARCC